ncbi:hypothetical protein M5K25_002764 [Dendrobium thyrsiflorum]|uniref:Uncharacterized protein n=1 Tax=Dendrobium thyrsiflorum TaxID=117978 RepID=A0ABD0VNJ5_DENTH
MSGEEDGQEFMLFIQPFKQRLEVRVSAPFHGVAEPLPPPLLRCFLKTTIADPFIARAPITSENRRSEATGAAAFISSSGRPKPEARRRRKIAPTWPGRSTRSISSTTRAGTRARSSAAENAKSKESASNGSAQHAVVGVAIAPGSPSRWAITAAAMASGPTKTAWSPSPSQPSEISSRKAESSSMAPAIGAGTEESHPPDPAAIAARSKRRSITAVDAMLAIRILRTADLWIVSLQRERRLETERDCKPEGGGDEGLASAESGGGVVSTHEEYAVSFWERHPDTRGDANGFCWLGRKRVAPPPETIGMLTQPSTLIGEAESCGSRTWGA